MLTLDELLPLQCWSTESTVSFCFPSKPWVLSTGCMFLSSLPTSMETSYSSLLSKVSSWFFFWEVEMQAEDF